VDAKVTHIDDQFLTLHLAGTFRYPDDRLFFTVWAERQPNAFLREATEFSPYFDVLGARSPYTEAGARGTRSYDDVDVTLGASRRGVTDAPGARPYEQDFSRYFVDLFFPAVLGHEKLTLGLNYDRYVADASDFGSVSGELGYAASRKLRFAAGSSYALYDFDPWTGLLRDHVREHYVAADWKFLEDWRLRSRLVFEPMDGGDFRTFELSARYSF
jgi:hypothetical protein